MKSVSLRNWILGGLSKPWKTSFQSKRRLMRTLWGKTDPGNPYFNVQNPHCRRTWKFEGWCFRNKEVRMSENKLDFLNKGSSEIQKTSRLAPNNEIVTRMSAKATQFRLRRHICRFSLGENDPERRNRMWKGGTVTLPVGPAASKE